MPNMPAAEKALRQTKKRTAKNSMATAEIGKMKAAIKKAIAEKDEEKIMALFSAFQAKVDKETKNGLFKKSSGARTKSRVAALVNKK
jgi:ribosomal protein S20